VGSWAAINFLTWMVLRMFPFLPAHDGLRQLVPSFFFMPVLAGHGAYLLAGSSRRALRWAGRGLIVGCIATAGWSTVQIHPFELSYYNELIGGPKGAKAAGMESTYFWDAATSEVLGWMNDHLPNGSTVVIFPPPNIHTFDWEQRWGRLRPDLRFRNFETLNAAEIGQLGGNQPWYLLFQMRQGLYMPRSKGDDSFFARLAEAPALFDFAPRRVGVRLLAIFDTADFRRSLEQAGAPARR
jgi:hypothetical protein